ncbi:MAG: SGNH/GDSL hydrolase family protein [Prochloraceae cyanobacterium]|nr:SGNH/GDSL hydrolase family protein [Prochloraceae cyanobacterium]
MLFSVLLVVLVLMVVIVTLLEVGLRLTVGLGNPLIYIPDEEIGYLLAPNQKVRRMGNRIEINQYSMRSDSFSEVKPASVLRVLLLGDSIANGGWWTDRDETISALMREGLKSTFETVEVLNASANSWGPRNELAYLQKFGCFDAQAIVLLINTDDLFAVAPTSIPVGRDRSYPDRKPPLALAEVLSRFVANEIPEMEKVNAEGGDRVGFNLKAIEQIKAISTDAGAGLILAMTPLLREVRDPSPRDYEKKARLRLQEFAETENINYIDFLSLFQATEEPESLYRDHIHLNLKGNKLVSEKLVISVAKHSTN